MIKTKKYTNHNYSSAYELIDNLYKRDEPFGDIIKETFEIMGNLLDIDVLEINIYNHSYSGFINKHVWNKPGIKSRRFKNMKSISITSSMFDLYKDNKYILFNDTRKLMGENKDFQRLSKFLHIRSICIFPIRVGKEVVAELVLKYHLKRRRFTEDQINFTSKCHQLIESHFIKKFQDIILDLNKNFYLELIDNFLYPVALLDYNFNLIKVNREFENFFDISKKDILKLDFVDFISESERNKIIKILKKISVNKKDYHEIFKMINNEKKIIQIIPFPLVNHDIKLLGIMFKDVTNLKIKEKKLIKMAYFDSTTNLYNRNYYKEVCQEVNTMDYQSLGVILFDIDNLNQINKLYGHEKGDKVIKEVSGIIRDVFEDDYLVSQLGGDEFIVFMLNQTEEELKQKIMRVNSIIGKQVVGHCISNGYSFTGNKNDKIQDLIHQADTQLHTEKQNKQN
ncbi:GGDEF domain-containing protein [Mycoplasmatota bacterium]|nr:GGDEF domain-containing protein [Mycoplasmatota bacterium]